MIEKGGLSWEKKIAQFVSGKNDNQDGKPNLELLLKQDIKGNLLKELFFSQFTMKRLSKNRPTVLKKHDDKYYLFDANSETHKKVIVANGTGYILTCDYVSYDFDIEKGAQDGYYGFDGEKLGGLDKQAVTLERFLTESYAIHDCVNDRFNFRVAYHKALGKVLLHNDVHKTAYDLDILLNMGFNISVGKYPLRFVKFGSQVMLSLMIDGILLTISPFSFSAPCDSLFEITL